MEAVKKVVDDARLIVSEGGSPEEVGKSVEKLALLAVRELDRKGAKLAMEVVFAAQDFLEHYGKLPGQRPQDADINRE